jgi:imidazole glycerol-phosphate synthase subunit HisH
MTTRPLIGVVDHGAGNLVSIGQALEAVGAAVRLVEGPGDLAGTDGIVLPGVGHTGAAMAGLRAAGLVEAMRAPMVPLLGICVGLQVLFEHSDEDGGACLGVIAGRVTRLVDAPTLPHMGWNQLDLVADDPLFEGIADGSLFYFVHSYAPSPTDPSVVVATATHGRPLVAAVRSGAVVGTQFHPERSGADGLRVLGNFLRVVVGDLPVPTGAVT